MIGYFKEIVNIKIFAELITWSKLKNNRWLQLCLAITFFCRPFFILLLLLLLFTRLIGNSFLFNFNGNPLFEIVIVLLCTLSMYPLRERAGEAKFSLFFEGKIVRTLSRIPHDGSFVVVAVSSGQRFSSSYIIETRFSSSTLFAIRERGKLRQANHEKSHG